jgi:RND family efflux transporter MFP subunit
MTPMPWRVVSRALLLASLPLAACGRPGGPAVTAASGGQVIGPDNIAVVVTDSLRAGPAISGTLVADREARLRAEVAGAVLDTYAEPGERVAAGTLLARLDDAAIKDAAQSARSAAAQARLASEQAARELRRAKTLAAAGAIAERDVEAAERAALGAQAALADAEARVASAEKALRNTGVRAPFAGVVAERVVSPGDIVTPGAALYTVVDPRSLRVEADVPTAALADVRVGAPVVFRVNGSDRALTGRVTRVVPMVNPQTRQVRLLASVPAGTGGLVAGLFVEGRVVADVRQGLMVPEQAVDQTGVVAQVMRLKGGKVEKVEVTRGLAAGDTVLLGAARGISAGTAVSVSAPTDARPGADAPAGAKGG